MDETSQDTSQNRGRSVQTNKESAFLIMDQREPVQILWVMQIIMSSRVKMVGWPGTSWKLERAGHLRYDLILEATEEEDGHLGDARQHRLAPPYLVAEISEVLGGGYKRRYKLPYRQECVLEH